MSIENLRNIAIVAHVDHGKTTLVDQLLKQSGTFNERTVLAERVMDSNDQEKERGITILSKNTAITWNGNRINIVDTPGHADFGGEVERVLSMVDSVLLLVDAMDGPMPQTRFVTQKAFQMGFTPDRRDQQGRPPGRASGLGAEPDLRSVRPPRRDQRAARFSGRLRLGACTAIAGLDPERALRRHDPAVRSDHEARAQPPVDADGPFQMRISQLDYSNYVGLIGIGRMQRGKVRTNMPVAVLDREGKKRNGKVLQVLGFMGLERREVEEAEAGDIIAINGIEGLGISDTICAPEAPEQLPVLTVDEPTISMTFQVNNSPFAGQKEHAAASS
jgi:GTP-binding protein